MTEPSTTTKPTRTSLPKAYVPRDVEDGIYERWLAADVFAPDGSGSRADEALPSRAATLGTHGRKAFRHSGTSPDRPCPMPGKTRGYPASAPQQPPQPAVPPQASCLG